MHNYYEANLPSGNHLNACKSMWLGIGRSGPGLVYGLQPSEHAHEGVGGARDLQAFWWAPHPKLRVANNSSGNNTTLIILGAFPNLSLGSTKDFSLDFKCAELLADASLVTRDWKQQWAFHSKTILYLSRINTHSLIRYETKSKTCKSYLGVKWLMTAKRSEYAWAWYSWKRKKWNAIRNITYYTQKKQFNIKVVTESLGWGFMIHEETPYGRRAAATILPSSFNILKVDEAFRCQQKRWDKGKHMVIIMSRSSRTWDTQDNHFTESITSNFMPVDRRKRLSSGSIGSIYLPHPSNRISGAKTKTKSICFDRINWIRKIGL